ncbi:glycoside hydrolase family 9 protein [Actinophytocola oryzae]|uniref:Endoglucanase n=1 Tax=Actinophytocola oryzae TaxID=502181 RepID=A0A4R7V5R6_9PSEU|nr:glycoside hydrolase family 9 protein [Actinophytocola oryzae]TDV44759.1 non-processive endocellulase [Actinophytocola oryzae]
MVIKNWWRAMTAAAVLLALGAPLAASAEALEAVDYERVVNGAFDSGAADPWWTGPGTAGRVSGGEWCVDVTGGAVNGYDALVGQNGVPYEAGQSYTLRFDARAATLQQVSAVAGEAVAPYRQIAKLDANLTPTAQTFTFTFQSSLDFPAAGNGQLTFWLGGQTFDNTVCVDNVSLVGGVLPPPGLEPAPPVRVNQVGYLPNLPKRATVATESTTPLVWTLKNAAGTAVARGRTVPKGLDAGSGENVHIADFSSYTRQGSGYTLTVGDDTSFPFDISTTALTGLRYDSLAFFYHQRSGTPIEAQYVGAAHARPAGHVNVAPNRGDNAVPCRADLACGYTLDVRGGWYDAGDHGKYVVNGGISAWQLQNEYERALRLGDAAALGDGTLDIPERSNGVPDVLDEARWEVEFLLRMQVPDGKPLAGMAHHKIHDEQWTGLPTRPDQDAQPRRLSAPSTAATLNLAAAAAQAARLWKTYDPAFASRALAAAEKAYAAAKAHPDVLADPNDGQGGGTYSDSTVSDEFYWAAAELFATTGRYRADVTGSPLYAGKSLTPRGFDWAATGALGDITLAIVPTSLPASGVSAIRAALVSTADTHLANMASAGHPAPYRTEDGRYEWGSNGLVANNGVVLALAYDLTRAPKYRDGVFTALDYLLGRNPADYSYVAGYGEQAVRNVHHRFWANQLDPSLPNAPAGAMSGGPNSRLQDPVAARLLTGCAPQRCFVDHIEAYSVNEVTVNWNSAFAWLSNWTAEQSDAAGACRVTYDASTWATGLTAQVTLTNTGTTPWQGFALRFAFGGDERLTSGWSATWSQQDRQVSANNESWQQPVPPGGTVTLGFNAGKTGQHTPPTRFTVNDHLCAA